MDVSVPSMHGISHKYHTEEAQCRIAPPKCKGTVLGKEKGRGEQHRKYGPEPVLEFLGMMETTTLVRHEQVHTVQQRHDAGTKDWGRGKQRKE